MRCCKKRRSSRRSAGSPTCRRRLHQPTRCRFPNESFDLVCGRLAAHHFPDLENFVAEVRRVLKNGGRFALVDNVAPDRERLPGATEDKIEDAILAHNAFEKCAIRVTDSRRHPNSGPIFF